MMKNNTIKKINSYTLPLGSVLMGISSLPQIAQMIKTKSSVGVNPWFIGAVALSISTFIFNGYVIYKETDNKQTMLSQIPNFLGMVAILVLIFVFR